MSKKLYIYGASGHGKVVFDIAKACEYEIVGFVDDDRNKKELLGIKIISFEEYLKDRYKIALGIGDNLIRYKIFEKLKANGIEIVTLIHPTAVVSNFVEIKDGSVVMPNCVINSGVIIKEGAIINSAVVIEHDCEIGAFVHVSPNCAIAGGCKIGDFTHIGIGSCVIQGINIESNCIIGAGSVVIRNIPSNSKVVGNPANRFLNYENR